MSAKNRINPDHYKTGDPAPPRETPKNDGGEAVKPRKKKTSAQPNFIPGAAPVGETSEPEEE